MCNKNTRQEVRFSTLAAARKNKQRGDLEIVFGSYGGGRRVVLKVAGLFLEAEGEWIVLGAVGRVKTLKKGYLSKEKACCRNPQAL